MLRGKKTGVEKDKENLGDATGKAPGKGRNRPRALREVIVAEKEVKKENIEDAFESSSSSTEDQRSTSEDIKPDKSLALVPFHQVDYIQKIRNLPFQASKWPRAINSHVTRHFFEISQENPKTNSGEAKFDIKAEDHCIICGLQDDAPNLVSCQGHVNGLIGSGRTKLGCKSVFHLDCIMGYNASDYCLTYIVQPECQNELLCPLHFCDICFFERKKQSAFVGKLVECALCLRSFHYENCSPVGSKDLELTLDAGDNKYKIEMVICPAHRPPKEVKYHLPCCCECETDQPGVELVRCRICIRSFHSGCRTAETIDGKPVPADLCEFCLTGECVRFDSPVIAKWTDNKFYPAVTRDWSKCPTKLRRSDKYDQLAYCTLEWKGEKTNQLSICPIADFVPMFESSIKFLGKKMKPNFLKAWQILIDRSEEFVQYESLLKEVRRKIDTSKYAYKDGEKTGVIFEPEKYVCDCSNKEGSHCNTESCSNRREYYECPPDCNKKGVCNNRGISDRKVNPNCEKRQTVHKGYGVFATGPIKAGEFIAEYAGEIINKPEIEKRNNLIAHARDVEANLYMMSLSNGRAVDATRAGNIARYMNHSCDPNCQTVKRLILIKERRDEVCYDYRIAIVAIKDIGVDEELTFKYMMDVVELTNTVTPKCKCGARRCAGNLGGDVRDVSDEEDEEEEEDDEEDEEEEDEEEEVEMKHDPKKRKIDGQDEQKSHKKMRMCERDGKPQRRAEKNTKFGRIAVPNQADREGLRICIRDIFVERARTSILPQIEQNELFAKLRTTHGAMGWVMDKISEDLTPKMALVPVNNDMMLVEQDVTTNATQSLHIVEIESNDDEEVGGGSSNRRRSERVGPLAISYFPPSRRNNANSKKNSMNSMDGSHPE